MLHDGQNDQQQHAMEMDDSDIAIIEHEVHTAPVVVASDTSMKSNHHNSDADNSLADDSTARDSSVRARKRMSKIPVSRVSSIMRSCPNLTTVKNDAVQLTAHAAELFVRELVIKAQEQSTEPGQINYADLANYIAQSELDFLKDAIPQKITVRQYYHLKAQEADEALDED